jgi:hypothetical protein
MARAIADLERDILALSADDKRELLRVLTAELDAGEDVAALASEFSEAVERTSRSIDTTLDRLETFDEDLTRVRKEARESVLRSSERWPFPST